MLDNGVYNTDWHEMHGMLSNVQLFFTSPPYEDMINYREGNRKKSVENITGDEFIQVYWIELFEFFDSAIADDGVVCIVINDKVKDGVLSLTNYKGVLEVCNRGWNLVEHVPWLKTQALPKKGRRLQDWWEHIYIFSKSNKPKCYPERIRGVYSGETVKRYSGKVRKIGSGTNRQLSAGKANTLANEHGSEKHHHKIELHDEGKLMPNILVVTPDLSSGKKHPARFPSMLPEWGITLFTDEGDMVCDPMCGSGTTVCMAKSMRRNYIGSDITETYYHMSEDELEKTLVQETFLEESITVKTVGDVVQEELF